MQIIYFPKSRDVRAELTAMASSHRRLDALRGQKLLALLQHLEAEATEQRVYARLLLKELTFSANAVAVKVWVDWNDYGPVQDGIPQAHYRLQIQRENLALSEDIRTETPEEVRRVISQAFGWSQ
jgi:hypothetical protein